MTTIDAEKNNNQHNKKGFVDDTSYKVLPTRSENFELEISFLISEASKLRLKGIILCCSFCRNNNETQIVYESHNKTDVSGKVKCPILANHKCDVCGGFAHTRNYCEVFKRQTKLRKIERYGLSKN